MSCQNGKDKTDREMSAMGGNLIKGAIALAILGAIMGFTNPQQTVYTEYASTKLIGKAEKMACEKAGLCDKAENMPGVAKNIVKNQLLKPAIEASTQRQNLVVFSIYTTDVPGVAKIKTLGALGNFFTFSES